ncbi:MAG: polysaccharide deacetylase family protein [Pseudorhodoferax sp.]
MLDPVFRVLSRGKLSVLLFHKVPRRANPLAPHEIDLATFTNALEAARSLFRIIPLSDAVTAMRAGTLPPRAACITFDDGYREWALGAVPVLQRLQIHATFFITTGQFRGLPIWSERILHAISAAPAAREVLDLGVEGLSDLLMASNGDRQASIARVEAQLKYMPLAEREQSLQRLEDLCEVRRDEVEVMPETEVRALHAAGFGIGSHTVAHPILARCTGGEAYREIAEAREHLEGMIGGRVDGFAYPNGIPSKDFDASHVDMVRRAGYRYAVTTGWGTASAGNSPFQIPRFTPWGPTFGRMAWQFARNLRRPAVPVTEQRAPTRRALMIAFHFPPQSGSSGVLRTANFVKNLPQLGWEPAVLSAQPRAYEQVRTDLIDTIPPATQVLRAGALDAARHLSVAGKYPLAFALPDRWSTWWIPGVMAGLRHIRRERTDLVWSTYPIATAHLIAATLARLTGLPWVADFRDPMVSEGYPKEPAKLRLWQRLERHVLEHARLCVFTTERAAATYRQRYPQAAHRCVVVENGYDEDVFAGILPDRQGTPHDVLLLLHSGLIYPRDRDPAGFFAAVSSLLRDGTLQRERLRIRFRAPVHGDEVMRVAALHGVADVVEIAGPLSHGQAIAEMMGADLLLLFQGQNFNAQIPAKVYEYLRAQRPVMAVVDRAGDTAQLVAQYHEVFLASIDSEAENRQALMHWLAVRGADAAENFSANLSRLKTSSRAEQARTLARYLDTVATPAVLP